MSQKRVLGDPVIQEEDSSSAAGSQEGPVRKKSREIAPAKNWCFTWHFEEEPPDVNWSGLPGVAGGIVGQEVCPTTNRKHLQGYLQFEHKTRPFSLSLPKTVHWEAAKGSPAANYTYCSKEGKFEAWGTVKMHAPEPPLKLLTEPRPWQAEVLTMVAEEPDDRTIVWLWEPTGNAGKSALSKLLCAKHGAIVCAGKAADMKFQIAQCKPKPKIVIFDVPRSNTDWISYTGIEEIKNGCFASSKYESGMVLMNSPHILVYSNQRPDTHKMSADRWKIGQIVDQAIVWE